MAALMTSTAAAKAPPRRTPLYETHQKLGARIIDFGGWAMPVQYSSILEEHRAVRTAVGLFDVCHMGEVTFSGPGALAAVSRLCTNNILGLADGQARYTGVLYPDGGFVDDCIVYRRRADDLLIVINAANRDKDIAWFRQQTAPSNEAGPVTITDRSDDTGLIAVQGPHAPALLARLQDVDVTSALASFTFTTARLAGHAVEVARTGYTGEDGFELTLPADQAAATWNALVAAGVKPCGLGARDTLRLEACLSLYGNDIDATTTPYEAGLGWIVKLDHDFIGRAALEAQKARGLTRRLVAFVMAERGTARHGYDLYASPESTEAIGPIGVVTSGSLGPTVGQNIGLAYVPLAQAEPGTLLSIDCRGKRAAARVVKPPFYKRPRP